LQRTAVEKCRHFEHIPAYQSAKLLEGSHQLRAEEGGDEGAKGSGHAASESCFVCVVFNDL
jgi:hypothetical protein